MILSFLLNFFIQAFYVIFSLLPTVTTLPFGMDAALVTFVTTIKAISVVMWPFTDLFFCVLTFYSYKFTLVLVRFFLPGRIN